MKTKALICAFVFAYVKSQFSHDAAQICIQEKKTEIRIEVEFSPRFMTGFNTVTVESGENDCEIQ